MLGCFFLSQRPMLCRASLTLLLKIAMTPVSPPARETGAPDRERPQRERETAKNDDLDQESGREADPTSGDEFTSSSQPAERSLCVAGLLSEEVPMFDSDESTSSDDGQANTHNPRLVRPAPRRHTPARRGPQHPPLVHQSGCATIPARGAICTRGGLSMRDVCYARCHLHV